MKACSLGPGRPVQRRLRRAVSARRVEQGHATRRPFAFPIRKGQRLGCPSPGARVDGLGPRMPFSRAAGRQAIFLGTTEPRAARPESPAAGSVVGQGQLVLSTAGEGNLLDAHLRRTTSRRNGFSYWRDVTRCAHYHVTDTRQRSGGVEKYSSIASRQAPEQG
jgi:hypothetical protein